MPRYTSCIWKSLFCLHPNNFRHHCNVNSSKFLCFFSKVNTKCFLGCNNSIIKGPYIKYVGGSAGGFLWGPWNILWHILMDHETFFKIFDGPRNIFWCPFFIILFFKLKGLKHKISKLAIKEFKKDMTC